jgi:transcription initiation factor TFIID subunit 1
MSNSGGDIGAEILFGNVNERGELDNPDLDPETRKYLSSLTGSLAEKFFGDVIGLKGEKTDKADNTDYNKKSANAVDYEDIEELADDEARPISNAKFQNVDALALKKKRMEEEDYDYDGEKPAQTSETPATPGAQAKAGEVSTPAPQPEEEEQEDTPEEAKLRKEKKKQTNKFSSMLRSLRSLSEVSKRLRNAPTTVTPDMYSYQIGNEGPILKFSEMFAPESDIARPRKTVKFPEDRVKYDYARDEIQVFEVPLDPSEARTVQTAESIAIEEKEKREETGEIGFPLKKPEDLVDKVMNLKSYGERFELVEQYEWEDDIMWDVDGAQSMEIEDTELSNSEHSPLRVSTAVKTNEISFAPNMEVPSWAHVPVPEVQVKPETDQSDARSIDIKPDPSIPPTTPQPQTPLSVFNNNSNHSNMVNNANSNMEELPPAATPIPFTAAGEVSQAAIDEDLKHPDELLPTDLEDDTLKNVELSSGKWLSDIVWDDTSPSAKKIHFRLLLDLNDDQMIFEDENQDLDRLEGAAPGAIPVKRGRGRSGKRRHLMLPNRVLMSGIFMGRGREADKFNLSNDNYYLTKALQMRKRVEKTIQHSLPAWKIMMVKTHLEPPELREFHRPRTKFPINTNLRVIPAEDAKEKGKKKGASGLMRDLIRHRKDLSAREGRVILTEYVEEFPPMLNNLGMGSKIRNYYRKMDRSDNPTLSFNDGDNIMLEEEDMSPFLGDIPKGTTVQAIENNLYKAPMFRHNPQPTDFLLIKTADNKFAIREIPTTYSVGQLQPLIEVPAPNSRTANQFIKNRLQSFVYRVFREKRTENPSEQPNLKITDVATAFPGQSDNSIRKRLKHCAEFRRGGDDCGSWLLKDTFQLPSDEEIRRMISPEEVCAYESMLSGAQRLHDFGIERLHQVTPALQAAVQSVPAGHALRKACKFIEEELQLTSWNLTQNFINAMQGKGLLQITGFGDPSGRGEAYSYLRLAQKVANPKIEKDKEPKAIVTGTDADLRKVRYILPFNCLGHVVINIRVIDPL